MPTSPASKNSDIVLLSHEFCMAALIEPILQEFNAFIMAESLINPSSVEGPSYGAIGKLGEIAHHFGPVLKLNGKNGRTVSIRIPWEHIRAVISGVAPETDGTRFNFAIRKRHKPNPH
jgi:hypothetical protein